MVANAAETVNDWLGQPENADAAWLFGDILRKRMAQPDWLENPALQVIARKQGRALSQVVTAVRQSVVGEESLAEKRNQELNPGAADFDKRIEDFLAELVAVVYLRNNGFSNFQFLTSVDRPMPDLRAVKGTVEYFVEVKNLREPNSPTIVAFSRWHRKRIEEPDRFQFTVGVDFLSQIEPGLDTEQVKALKNVVDSLPERERPSEFHVQLPKGLELRITLNDGSPVMYSHGTGGALDPLRESRTNTFLVKVLNQTSKALRQLYASHLDPRAARLLLLRWRVPSDAWFIADEIRDTVRSSLEAFLRPYFANLEVHILNNTDNLETS